ENGRQALDLAKRLKPDLVLLDIVMPGMDGYEVAPQLKAMSGDIYLPIIFITALDDEASLVRCLEVGGDDFTTKPFDSIILTAKIRAHGRTRLLSKKAHEQNRQLTYYRDSIEREHAIVEHIFANALSVDSQLEPYIDYKLRPASDFNGDLFLMSMGPSADLYFLMGDFTGHGFASAIGALPVAKAFQTMSKKGLSLMEMAETLNQTLAVLLPADMFFAASLVKIAHGGQKIEVWNGGMPALLLLNDCGEITRRFESRHMALGILEDGEFESELERFEANYGDRLVGFSDGLVEVSNKHNQMLGEKAIEDWLRVEPNISIDDLMNKMNAYLGAREREDDVTVVSYYCQEMDGLIRSCELSDMPFKIEMDLSAEQIKKNDPIQNLMEMINSQTGLISLHCDLHTVLSELYNNALDHGLLHLDPSIKQTEDGFFTYFELRKQRLRNLVTGNISIRVQYIPQDRRLSIEVGDSGYGFNGSGLSQLIDEDKCYGRGIPLVKELCDSVVYSNHGTRVNVIFKIEAVV
ncbi:MAG: CheY-like chemotaxis protein/anti-sigma regulatory factor (Ser/Thr protein kinase), partial [Paraglaciecola sp.]